VSKEVQYKMSKTNLN